MMAVNSTQDLSSSVGRFYLPLNRTAVEDPVFSLPYMDEADGGDFTMMFCTPTLLTSGFLSDAGEFLVVISVDLMSSFVRLVFNVFFCFIICCFSKKLW